MKVIISSFLNDRIQCMELNNWPIRLKIVPWWLCYDPTPEVVKPATFKKVADSRSWSFLWWMWENRLKNNPCELLDWRWPSGIVAGGEKHLLANSGSLKHSQLIGQHIPHNAEFSLITETETSPNQKQKQHRNRNIFKQGFLQRRSISNWLDSRHLTINRPHIHHMPVSCCFVICLLVFQFVFQFVICFFINCL